MRRGEIYGISGKTLLFLLWGCIYFTQSMFHFFPAFNMTSGTAATFLQPQENSMKGEKQHAKEAKSKDWTVLSVCNKDHWLSIVPFSCLVRLPLTEFVFSNVDCSVSFALLIKIGFANQELFELWTLIVI